MKHKEVKDVVLVIHYRSNDSSIGLLACRNASKLSLQGVSIRSLEDAVVITTLPFTIV